MASEAMNTITKDEAEAFRQMKQGIQQGEQRIIDLLKSGKSPEEIINNR